MRIAMAQMSSTDDVEANLRCVQGYVERAVQGGADLVVFPESAMHRWVTESEPEVKHAQPLDGPFVIALRQLAAKHGVAMIVGVSERIDGDDQLAYNSVVAIDDAGEVIGVYRKTHLFDAFGFKESDSLLQGPGDLLVLQVKGHKVGVAICYDLRFPELSRALVDSGATTIVYPSAWVGGPLKESHWQTLLRARSIENLCWVVGVSQAELRHIGCSTAVDPMGVVVSALGDAPGIAFVDVEIAPVEAARTKIPSLANRRFGVTFND